MHIPLLSLTAPGPAPAWPRRIWAETLMLFVPLACVVVGVVVLLGWPRYALDREELARQEADHARIGGQRLLAELATVVSDLRYLAASETLRERLDDPTPRSLARLQAELSAFSASKRIYDQVRLLDDAGQEVVRVNHAHGRTVVVAPGQLQNKRHRYYFREAMALSAGEIFVSPLDLNIENRVIERPFKPMIRVGAPVFDSTGAKRGVVLLNYLGTRLIARLRDAHGADARIMLLNAQGYWLAAPDPADEWGFMLGNGRAFARRHPQAWRRVSAGREGQVETGEGLFSFATVHPLRAAGLMRGGTGPAASSSGGASADMKWIVVTHVTPDRLSALSMNHVRWALLQIALWLGVAGVTSVLVTCSRRRARMAAGALEEGELRLREITRSMAEGLVVLVAGGRVSYMNPAAERMTGWDLETLRGRDFNTLLPAPDAGSAEQGTAQRESAVEAELLCRDGARLPVAYLAATIENGPEKGATVISFQDIRERQRIERQLLRSETLAALGGMVAGVAHEINTPVGVAVTAASHLTDRSQEIHESLAADRLTRNALVEYLETCSEAGTLIERNLARAAELIRSFRMVAADQASELSQAFELRRYLEDILTTLRPRLKNTAHLVEVRADGPIEITSYPGAIAQIASNLVINSLVHAYREGSAGRMRFSLGRVGDDVVMRYEDDGVGMCREHLDRAFQPFFTTRRGEGSTGLGLHIVHNLVTKVLRGAIEAESEPGQGVRFTIRFPATLEPGHV